MFEYEAKDLAGNVSIEQLEIIVGIAPNTPPTAVDDQATALFAETKLIDVLANDSDLEGSISLLMVADQVGGAFTIEASQVRYSPTAGFS